MRLLPLLVVAGLMWGTTAQGAALGGSYPDHRGWTVLLLETTPTFQIELQLTAVLAEDGIFGSGIVVLDEDRRVEAMAHIASTVSSGPYVVARSELAPLGLSARQGGPSASTLHSIFSLHCVECEPRSLQVVLYGGVPRGGQALTWQVSAEGATVASTSSGDETFVREGRDFSAFAEARAGTLPTAVHAQVWGEHRIIAARPLYGIFMAESPLTRATIETPRGVRDCPCTLLGDEGPGDHRFELTGVSAMDPVLILTAPGIDAR